MTTTPTAVAMDETALLELAAQPRSCLLHEDIHTHHGRDCIRAFLNWRAAHGHLTGHAVRDAYAREVEQRILAKLARVHAPHLFAKDDEG